MAVFLQNASGNSRCSTFSQTNIAESQWVFTHHSSLIINNFTTVQEFWRTPENAQGQQNVFQESKDITSLVANSRKVLGAYGRLATLTCPEIWCGQAVDCNNSLKRRRRHTCCSQKKWMLAWHRRSADVYFTFTAHFIAFYVKQINSTLGRDFSVKKQQIASLPVMEVRYQFRLKKGLFVGLISQLLASANERLSIHIYSFQHWFHHDSRHKCFGVNQWFSTRGSAPPGGVKKFQDIHVCKPTFWRSLLTQRAYCSTRTLPTRYCTMCRCNEHISVPN